MAHTSLSLSLSLSILSLFSLFQLFSIQLHHQLSMKTLSPTLSTLFTLASSFHCWFESSGCSSLGFTFGFSSYSFRYTSLSHSSTLSLIHSLTHPLSHSSTLSPNIFFQNSNPVIFYQSIKVSNVSTIPSNEQSFHKLFPTTDSKCSKTVMCTTRKKKPFAASDDQAEEEGFHFCCPST